MQRGLGRGVQAGWLLLACVAARAQGTSPTTTPAPLPDAPSTQLHRRTEDPEPATPPEVSPKEAARAARDSDVTPKHFDLPGKTEIEIEAQREVDEEEQQRILKVVPNFETVITGRGVQLSKSQKTELALHMTFDPFNAVSAFLLAGVSEVAGTYRGYGWGPGGYFKRVGANGLDVIDATMLAGAVYPILLHQDPRYFRKGTGTIRSRVRHALLGPFVCNGDNQKRQFNFSNVLGNFTAGAISNAYYPRENRGFGLAAVNSAIVLVEGGLGSVGLEFSPDVTDWWERRRARKQP